MYVKIGNFMLCVCYHNKKKTFFSPKGKHSGLSMENGLEGSKEKMKDQ